MLTTPRQKSVARLASDRQPRGRIELALRSDCVAFEGWKRYGASSPAPSGSAGTGPSSTVSEKGVFLAYQCCAVLARDRT